MIKIIKMGKHITTCKECDTKFSFEQEDIIRIKTGRNEEDIWIVCPVCGEEIYKKDWGGIKNA